MCSIIGYIGGKDAAQVIIDGLERMEYRGYDSAGIAGLDNGDLVIEKQLGRVKNLSNTITASQS